MSYDDDYEDDSWDEELLEKEDDDDPGALPCPECGAEVYLDADACPQCGYWITEADRKAAWRNDSASGRIVTIGLWALGAAAVAWLLGTLAF